MKTPLFFCLTLSFVTLSLSAQEPNTSFTVMSYNVENLFDTHNDPLTEDDAFCPEGEKAWDRKRYEKKIKDLAKVIRSLSPDDYPAVIGLLEVENRKVLEGLCAQKGLKKADYRIVHEDSKDPRGIDCALLYRPDRFKYISHRTIPVRDLSDPGYLHRDILYVKGMAPDGRSLHLFVNHWKSRSGGQEETRQKRMYAAMSLRREMDRLQGTESDPRIIIMGDFNDEPTNASVAQGLSAGNKRKNIRMGEHYNLFYDLHNIENKGSYCHKGQWNMLDQIIVSYNLIEQSRGLSTSWDGARIFKEEWMLYESEQYGDWLPSASYGGPNYYGGPSDHLPVYVQFKLR